MRQNNGGGEFSLMTERGGINKTFLFTHDIIGYIKSPENFEKYNKC